MSLSVIQDTPSSAGVRIRGGGSLSGGRVASATTSAERSCLLPSRQSV